MSKKIFEKHKKMRKFVYVIILTMIHVFIKSRIKQSFQDNEQ